MIEVQKITNGNYNHLFSKRILLIDDGPADIYLKFDGVFNVVLSFCFITKENEKSNLSYKTEDIESGLKIVFELINFNNSLGTGLINPISILNHNVGGINKKVVLTCFAYKHEKAHHILDIALYEEK